MKFSLDLLQEVAKKSGIQVPVKEKQRESITHQFIPISFILERNEMTVHVLKG